MSTFIGVRDERDAEPNDRWPSFQRAENNRRGATRPESSGRAQEVRGDAPGSALTETRRRRRGALDENPFSGRADADELDGDPELLLDELDIPLRGRGQLVPTARAVERLAPARKGFPDGAGVMKVTLVRGEVRRLRAIGEPVATQTGSSVNSESTSSLVNASAVIPLTRTA